MAEGDEAARPMAMTRGADRPAVAGPATRLAYTDFQWYFSRARNTVYFGAFTSNVTRERFRALVARLIELAPQLGWRQDDDRHTHVDVRPFPVDEIISYQEVASLDGFPDSRLAHNRDLFEDPNLPCFRAACWSLPPDVETAGNRAFILFRFSHALMEGVDAALLLRGRTSIHDLRVKEPGRRLPQRILAYLAAALLTPSHFTFAALHRHDPETYGVRTMLLDRGDVRRVAGALGVQQRSLLFALVMYGIFHHQAGGRPSRKPRIAAYSRLSSRRVAGDDDFMRLRMHLTLIRHRRTFERYVRRIDRTLSGVPPQSLGFQMHYNAVLGLHRRLSRLVPFIYRPRFFHYVPYDFVLSLVPPQVNGGEFADFGFNDIYCGSHTPGVNCCVFVPQQDRFSLNIYADRPILARVGGIEALARELGIGSPPRGSDQVAETAAVAGAEAAIIARSSGVAKSRSQASR